MLGVTSDPERAYVLGLTIISNGAASDIGTHIHQKSADHPYLVALFQVDPATGAGCRWRLAPTIPSAGRWTRRARRSFASTSMRSTGASSSSSARPGHARRYAPFWGSDFEHRFAYLGYASADNAVYLTQNDQLLRMDLDSGKTEPFALHPEHGVAELIWDPTGARVVGIEDGWESAHFDWLDPNIGAGHATLARAFKGQRVDLVSWSADGSRIVARATSHDAPPAGICSTAPAARCRRSARNIPS